jgi:purine-nucleoside phosphorylase
VVEIGGAAVHVLAGRRHLYEGIDPAQAGLAMRLLARLGVRRVMLTNAAGGLAERLAVGDLMLIVDHFNMTMRDPLRGTASAGSARGGDVYDRAMGDALRRAALEGAIALQEGIYAGLLGPNYETHAEVALLRRLGADAVGMSTVAESLMARSLGMRVAAISLITNTHAAAAAPPSHEEVLEAGRRASGRLIRLICDALPSLAVPNFADL